MYANISRTWYVNMDYLNLQVTNSPKQNRFTDTKGKGAREQGEGSGGAQDTAEVAVRALGQEALVSAGVVADSGA